MSEARKSERVRSLLSARIVFGNNSSTLDCVVKNFSSAGARLQISDTLALPTEFDLFIPHRGRSYRARIIWRGEDLLGAEFIDPHSGDHAPIAHEAEADQIDRLMKENAKLRAQVLELKQRVAQLSGEA